VIFEIFTVKLTAIAECTEFSKLEEGHVPQCPIASDATDVYQSPFIRPSFALHTVGADPGVMEFSKHVSTS